MTTRLGFRALLLLLSFIMFLYGFMYSVLFIPAILLEFYSIMPRNKFSAKKKIHKTILLTIGLVLVLIYAIGLPGISSIQDTVSLVKHVATGIWCFFTPGLALILYSIGVRVIPQNIDYNVLILVKKFRRLVSVKILSPKALYIIASLSMLLIGIVIVAGYMYMAYTSGVSGNTCINPFSGTSRCNIVFPRIIIVYLGITLGLFLGIIPSVYAIIKRHSYPRETVIRESTRRKLLLIMRYFILSSTLLLIAIGFLVIAMNTFKHVYAGILMVVLGFWVLNIIENPFTLVIMDKCYREILMKLMSSLKTLQYKITRE